MNGTREKVSHRRMLAAIGVVAILLGACFVCVGNEETTEESDAIVPAVFIPAIQTGIKVIGVIVSGYFALKAIEHYLDTGGTVTGGELRGKEAEQVANSITNNITNYDHSMKQFTEIWKLTNEHWIRQAEITSAELWSGDSEFSIYDALTYSGVYLNSSYMLNNATEQLNEMFTALNSSLTMWNNTENYKDKMTLVVDWGSGSASTKSNFEMMFGTTVPSVQSGHDKVYLSDETELWSSTASTITSTTGEAVYLSQGYNDLKEKITSGVYTLQPGVTYIGDMLYTLTVDAAPLYAGCYFTCGDTEKYAVYRNGGVVVDGVQNESFAITINPDGASAQTTSIYSIFTLYNDLMVAVNGTMNNSRSAASALWDIYDQAGKVSPYLTTLMVPSNYDYADDSSVTVSDKERAAITIMAMRELGRYWSENEGTIGSYPDIDMSESMTLLILGDIYDQNGELIAEDAIFTPWYQQDTDLKTGQKNTVKRLTYLTIWTTGYSGNLSSFAGTTSTGSMSELTAVNGWTLDIREMKNQGSMVQSISLKTLKIQYHEGGEYVVTQPIDPQTNRLGEVIMILMVVFGVLCLLGGSKNGNYALMLVGVGLIVVGVFFGGMIANKITAATGFRLEF